MFVYTDIPGIHSLHSIGVLTTGQPIRVRCIADPMAFCLPIARSVKMPTKANIEQKNRAALNMAICKSQKSSKGDMPCAREMIRTLREHLYNT